MLHELCVQNYALLDNINAPFNDGFNVLTGETGAGKSLLAGALSLLLGERADAGFIRQGSDEAEVSGLIVLAAGSEAALWLSRRSIALDDGAIIIRRIVRRNGRGVIYVGSNMVSREELAELAGLLFDMHGQHEHQSLYNKENQRKILDRAAGLTSLLTEYQNLYTQTKTTKEELANLRQESTRSENEREFLSYALAEIEEVNPSSAERESLSHNLKGLSSREKELTKLNHFDELTTEALFKLKEAAALLDHFEAGEAGSRFSSSLLELEDAAAVILALKDSFNFSPDELEAMQSRLQAMQRLEKKYGGTMESLLKFAAEGRAKLNRLENNTELEAGLTAKITKLEQELLEKAEIISQKRKETALNLQQEAEANLRELEMTGCRFVIEVKPRTKNGELMLTATGLDDVEFCFAPNIGSGLKPLKAIASGGEASRVLLALKSVLAKNENVPCLIFDEIDTGIGGTAARAVAGHLQKLAKTKQVLVITHLATIAAGANHHLKIEKKNYLNTTITSVTPISKTERIKEIARMLSGASDSLALAHAEAMLSEKE
ncbi:MAG: DNA repair protein RecN [Spirochaetaceae bacterium]|nr:DNA repair protein RecN [Spirochaetaceae bacterium]